MDNPRELIESARMAIQSLREILVDIDDCLKRLHEQTIASTVVRGYEVRASAAELEAILNAPEQPNVVIDPDGSVRRATAAEVVIDQRFPYLAGRQPRRDGDSFGTVPEPTDQGGTYYGKTASFERRRPATDQSRKKDGPDN